TGHRKPQGLAVHPTTGAVYDDGVITTETFREGMEQPLKYRWRRRSSAADRARRQFWDGRSTESMTRYSCGPRPDSRARPSCSRRTVKMDTPVSTADRSAMPISG